MSLPDFVRGPETTALVAALREMAPGDTISFGALSAKVGFDVNAYRSNLDRAREIVRRDGGGMVDLTDGGLRRLTDAEVVKKGADRYTVKAKNATKRAADALTSVHYGGLDDADKVTHNVKMSMLGAVRFFFGAKARRQMTEAVTNANASLPAADALRLFDKVK